MAAKKATRKKTTRKKTARNAASQKTPGQPETPAPLEAGSGEAPDSGADGEGQLDHEAGALPSPDANALVGEEPGEEEGTDGAANEQGPRLLIVPRGHWLHWPVPGTKMRGREGTVVRADDPLLNTCAMTPEFRVEHGLIESNQLFKLGPAPAGAVVTPTNVLAAQRVYAALGYDGVPEGDPVAHEAAQLAGGKRTAQRTKVTVPKVLA